MREIGSSRIYPTLHRQAATDLPWRFLFTDFFHARWEHPLADFADLFLDLEVKINLGWNIFTEVWTEISKIWHMDDEGNLSEDNIESWVKVQPMFLAYRSLFITGAVAKSITNDYASSRHRGEIRNRHFEGYLKVAKDTLEGLPRTRAALQEAIPRYFK